MTDIMTKRCPGCKNVVGEHGKMDHGWPIVCAWCGESVDDIPEFEEAWVPFEWRAGVETDLRFWKDCYRQAGLYVARHPEAMLVHGYILHPLELADGTTFNLPINHAWAELPDGTIFDGVWQKFVSRGDYARLNRAVEQSRFTALQMWSLTVRTSHWGPWNPQERAGQ